MFFGAHPFEDENGALVFAPKPALPAYLIPEERTVEAMLLGTIRVTYCFEQVRDYIPGAYSIKNMVFTYENGSEANVAGGRAKGRLALDVREGHVAEILVNIEPL